MKVNTMQNQNIHLVTTPARRWVLAIAAGTDEQAVWSEHRTLEDAIKEAWRWQRAGFSDLDVMKRREDGTLTTEF